jgi:hypothetical protein
MKAGNSTHVKFGGYDKEGILSDNNLHFLKTNDNTNWLLPLTTVKIGENMVNIAKGSAVQTRYVLFELAFPFIYVPISDF